KESMRLLECLNVWMVLWEFSIGVHLYIDSCGAKSKDGREEKYQCQDKKPVPYDQRGIGSEILRGLHRSSRNQETRDGSITAKGSRRSRGFEKAAIEALGAWAPTWCRLVRRRLECVAMQVRDVVYARSDGRGGDHGSRVYHPDRDRD